MIINTLDVDFTNSQIMTTKVSQINNKPRYFPALTKFDETSCFRFFHKMQDSRILLFSFLRDLHAGSIKCFSRRMDLGIFDK